MREDYRRWVLTTVQPVADMIAREFSEKLGRPVALDLRPLWAHDLVGRSTALKSLVEAGVGLADAQRMVGLE